MTIDEVRLYVEHLMKREITGDEILIMGIAYIQGMITEREKNEQ